MILTKPAGRCVLKHDTGVTIYEKQIGSLMLMGSATISGAAAIFSDKLGDFLMLSA